MAHKALWKPRLQTFIGDFDGRRNEGRGALDSGQSVKGNRHLGQMEVSISELLGYSHFHIERTAAGIVCEQCGSRHVPYPSWPP